MRRKILCVTLSILFVLSNALLAVSAAEPDFSHWPYATGFEGTDDVDFVYDFAALGQYGWRAYEHSGQAAITTAGEAINPDSGSVKFSSDANSQNGGATGARIEKKSSGSTIRLEKTIAYANAETSTFDHTKDYLISFRAKLSGTATAKFHLMNNATFGGDGFWGDNYSIDITISDEWKYYFILLGPNTANSAKLENKRSIEYFSLEGAGYDGVLCIDEYQVKNISLALPVGSKELILDGSFESAIYDGQVIENVSVPGAFNPTRFSLTAVEAANGDVVKYSEAAAHSGKYGLEIVRGRATGGSDLRIEKSIQIPPFADGNVYRISFWATASVGNTFRYATISANDWGEPYNFNRNLNIATSLRRYSIIWGPRNEAHPLYKYFDHTYTTGGYSSPPILIFAAKGPGTLYLDDFSVEEVHVADVSMIAETTELTASSLKADVYVKNNDTTAAKNDVKIFAGIYDGNGILMNVAIAENSLSIGQDHASTGDGLFTAIVDPTWGHNGFTFTGLARISFDLSGSIMGKGYKLVYYAWDADTFKPLSDKKVMNVDSLAILKPVI